MLAGFPLIERLRVEFAAVVEPVHADTAAAGGRQSLVDEPNVILIGQALENP